MTHTGLMYKQKLKLIHNAFIYSTHLLSSSFYSFVVFISLPDTIETRIFVPFTTRNTTTYNNVVNISQIPGMYYRCYFCRIRVLGSLKFNGNYRLPTVCASSPHLDYHGPNLVPLLTWNCNQHGR